MSIIDTIITYSVPEFLLLSAVGLAVLRNCPHLFLQHAPKDARRQAPTETPEEKRLRACWRGVLVSLMVAFPSSAALDAKAAHQGLLGLFASACGVTFLVPLVDWLLLDWLAVCTITPRWVMIAGTGGTVSSKKNALRFRGFLLGTVLSVVVGIVVAALVWYV